MAKIAYPVYLTDEQREILIKRIKTGKHSAYEQTVAHVLLQVDRSDGRKPETDEKVAEMFSISRRTVIRIKKRFVEEHMQGVLSAKYPKERPERRKIQGKEEAKLIVLACGASPDGSNRWTLRLLAEKMVELQYVETVSHETIRQVLKKNELKPWLKKSWCFPTADAEFVCAMEDILEVYCLPYDEDIPLVCVDEMNKNLVKDKREPEPMNPGKVRREDYTYEKEGSANIFLACEPLVGKRYLKVTHQRTKIDFAEFIRYILEECYPKAKKVKLVLDNLNTHKPASLYEAFPPEKARALINRLEIHYTPKHASWLNMAEIEFSVLVRRGLKENIATRDELVKQVKQWEQRRNGVGTVVHWRFTTADARMKLSRLYPVLEEIEEAA